MFLHMRSHSTFVRWEILVIIICNWTLTRELLLASIKTKSVRDKENQYWLHLLCWVTKFVWLSTPWPRCRVHYNKCAGSTPRPRTPATTPAPPPATGSTASWSMLSKVNTEHLHFICDFIEINRIKILEDLLLLWLQYEINYWFFIKI